MALAARWAAMLVHRQWPRSTSSTGASQGVAPLSNSIGLLPTCTYTVGRSPIECASPQLDPGTPNFIADSNFAEMAWQSLQSTTFNKQTGRA